MVDRLVPLNASAIETDEARALARLLAVEREVRSELSIEGDARFRNYDEYRAEIEERAREVEFRRGYRSGWAARSAAM